MPTPRTAFDDLKLDAPIPEEVNGRRNGVNNDPAWETAYHPCPEAFSGDDVPQGRVVRFEDWESKTGYPGTRRDLRVYVPPTDSLDGARVMFFNDGAWYLSRSGPVRAGAVLDSLLAGGEIAPTVAVFIMPGNPDHAVPGPIESYDDRLSQRSLEYDSLSSRYGEFLFDEVAPFVAGELGIAFSDDPDHCTMCGISSGGIAAFTAAWHFPDRCRRVLSHCGSFTDIWGGHNYPSLIRKTPRKPVRVFLQSGEKDANTPFGDWALANKAMASALDYAGYDYRFEFGVGGHSLNHGGALFADSLRWLWRDEDRI